MYDPKTPGYTPLHELAELIRTRQLSPVDLTEATLRRIEEVDGSLGGYITVMAERAMEDARTAERAVVAGEPLGPLHGVPVPIKDLEAVEGVRLTHGSVPDDEIADSDALSVERIRAAGGIIVGKTNTPEYGHAGTTENRVFGPARNPWNRERTPGGSSGGAAVSVAAGMTSVAQGTDGGGSVRIPSALSGIYGIKATQGRIPRRHSGDFSWHPINNSSVGPMTWTVRDAAILLNVMAGPSHDAEYTTLPDAPPDFTTLLAGGVGGLKVALSTDLGGAAVDPEVVDAVVAAARVLEELGAVVDEVDYRPEENQTYMALFYDFFCIKGYASQGHLVDDPESASQLTDYFRANLEHGRSRSGAEYAKVLNGVGKYRAYAEQFFGEYDLLVTPVTAVPAFEIDRHPTVIDGREVENPRWAFIPFTPMFNLTGNPAASVPCGFSSDGLPIGLHLVGALKDEGTVLAASAAFEEARPWTTRRPEL